MQVPSKSEWSLGIYYGRIAQYNWGLYWDIYIYYILYIYRERERLFMVEKHNKIGDYKLFV